MLISSVLAIIVYIIFMLLSIVSLRLFTVFRKTATLSEVIDEIWKEVVRKGYIIRFIYPNASHRMQEIAQVLCEVVQGCGKVLGLNFNVVHQGVYVLQRKFIFIIFSVNSPSTFILLT